jgi:hypothetical protein
MSKNEDADHILTCQDATAQKERSDILYDALHKLSEGDMPTNIAVELECHLCQTLHIPSLQYYKSNEETDRTQVRTAVTHQNIIGWENALRGYVSSYWISKELIKGKNKRQLHKRYWDNMMVGSLIDIHRSIWNKRNEHMHGKTTQEARTKAREAVTHRVANIYKVKPKLASRYHPIDSIPYDQRIRRTTTQLKVWLAHIQHQIKIMDLLNATKQPGQLTIQEAMQNMQRAQEAVKYPP